jgi:voltage-gated sodium channel type II alpha
MLCIGANLFVMCFSHYGASESFENIITNINSIFVSIFAFEFLIKIISFKLNFFKRSSNMVDFIILVFSIISLLFDLFPSFFESHLFSPTAFRLLRIVRFIRILRLFKVTKGIRTILYALINSFSSLFNIGLLLFLIVFIYAIFGMNFFMNVSYSYAGVTEELNFENIFNSILILFPLCTSAGWNALLDSLSHEGPPFCDPNMKTNTSLFTKGDCGSMALATPFLISFIIITFFVVLNMYVAIILENFTDAKENMETGLTDDDFDLYCQVWQKFDPSNSGYIKYEDLSDFVDSLHQSASFNLCKSKPEIVFESPLRIPHPNKEELMSMNITICENDLIYFTDILEALVKKCLECDKNINFEKLKLIHKIRYKRPYKYKPISSTLKYIEGQPLCSNDLEPSTSQKNHDEIC